MNSRPPFGPILCHLSSKTHSCRLLHVVFHKNKLGLPRPTSTSTANHLWFLNAFPYPLIALPLNMSKPPKPTTSHNFRYTVNIIYIQLSIDKSLYGSVPRQYN